MNRRGPIALALLVIFLSVVAMLTLPVPEARRAFNRVRLGMTLSEVTSVVLPSGDYDGTDDASIELVREYGIPLESLWGPPDQSANEKWIWVDDSWIYVAFDESGQAIGIYLFARPTFADRVRRFLGL